MVLYPTRDRTFLAVSRFFHGNNLSSSDQKTENSLQRECHRNTLWTLFEKLPESRHCACDLVLRCIQIRRKCTQIVYCRQRQRWSMGVPPLHSKTLETPT